MVRGSSKMMQIMVTQKRSIGRRAALPPDSRSRGGGLRSACEDMRASMVVASAITIPMATQRNKKTKCQMTVKVCTCLHVSARIFARKTPWDPKSRGRRVASATARSWCGAGHPGDRARFQRRRAANTAPVYTRGSRGGHREKDAHGRRDAPVHRRAGGERVSGPSASRPGPYSWSPWPLGQWRVRRGGPIDLFWVIGKEAAPPVGR